LHKKIILYNALQAPYKNFAKLQRIKAILMYSAQKSIAELCIFTLESKKRTFYTKFSEYSKISWACIK